VVQRDESQTEIYGARTRGGICSTH
jgi:hypothetical protein